MHSKILLNSAFKFDRQIVVCITCRGVARRLPNYIFQSNSFCTKGTNDSKVQNPPSGGIGSTLNYANITYHEFERNLMARIKESNQRRFRIILALVVILVTWIVLVFGEELRKMLTDHTAGLAKETLENESLKIQTQELAMAVVQTVLNDQETAVHAATFLREAATNAETQKALVNLAIHIVQHRDTLNELIILSKKIIKDLVNDKVQLSHLTGFSL